MTQSPLSSPEAYDDPSRTQKRLSTLEKDKMRLWKMQNDQHVTIEMLTQQLSEQAQKLSKQSTFQEQRQQQLSSANAQLQFKLKRTQRLLNLSVILIVLLAVTQVNWLPLWHASQHIWLLIQARMTGQ
ncbi:hypothetical protein [Celerinatantimonas yamalensis]|uniref:Uncharacterized protein n=1 Tax=Celerinatantimonas yamalensis TaxID=559956 RepID=A0ABW9G8K6_9GAMM